MEEQRYNGWATYETWLVTLWLGNEEATNSDVQRLVSEWIATTEDGGLLQDLADALASYVAGFPSVESCQEDAALAADLLGAALGRVDWRNLAEGLSLDALGSSSTEARAEIARRASLYLDSLAAPATIG